MLVTDHDLPVAAGRGHLLFIISFLMVSLIPDDLDQNPFVSLAIEFEVENLLPGT